MGCTQLGLQSRETVRTPTDNEQANFGMVRAKTQERFNGEKETFAAVMASADKDEYTVIHVIAELRTSCVSKQIAHTEMKALWIVAIRQNLNGYTWIFNTHVCGDRMGDTDELFSGGLPKKRARTP